MSSQGMLFSDPSVAETGVWCTLTDGIDPAHWAWLCRCIGSLDTSSFYDLFAQARRSAKPAQHVPVTEFTSEEIPLVSIGPSGINGTYQQQI